MKSELRKKLFEIRKHIPEKKREEASRVITQKILQLAEWKIARTICVYRSLATEVNTKKLFVLDKHIIPPESDEEADLYIVPGVAFDRKGSRLGRGKGFYDRLLEQSRAIKIGLAFEKQMLAKVPHFSYDVPMDIVITERSIYYAKKSEQPS